MTNTATIIHSTDKRSIRGVKSFKVITTTTADSRIKFIHSDDIKDIEEAEKVFTVSKDTYNLSIALDFVAYCLRLSSDNSGTVMFDKHLMKNVFMPGTQSYATEFEDIYVEYNGEFYYLEELLEN